MTLNNDQKNAKDEMYTSVDARENHVLMGFAGTGKTYLLSEIYKEMLASGRQVAFCTPTNKAAKVAREMGVASACTVYQLLCLAYKDGVMFQYKFPEFEDVEIIIIDECSMVNKMIMGLLEKYVPAEIPIIFVGDPYQLPPVKEEISLSFDTKNKSTLTEIVRQAAGSPIIEYSMDIRKNGFNYKKIPFDGKSILSIPPKKFLATVLNTYKGGGVTAAWTNKTVDAINYKAHTAIYGEGADDFCVGEKIVLGDPLLDPFDDSIVATVGDEFVVKSISSMGYAGYDAWGITTECDKKIYAIQEKEKAKYQAQLTRYYQAKDNFGYWKLKNRFTDIKLPYASTCHKLQGSTYSRVVIVGSDIGRNWIEKDRNKCAYVAVTRAADKIGFLEE